MVDQCVPPSTPAARAHHHSWPSACRHPLLQPAPTTTRGRAVYSIVRHARTVPGGSRKQQEARAAGLPFKLTAWTDDEGRAFYEAHVEPLLPAAWRALEAKFPETCREMLEAVPPEYRLKDTAFTKA